MAVQPCRGESQLKKNEKRKKEFKDKVCVENAPGKVIKKLEFIENVCVFKYF